MSRFGKWLTRMLLVFTGFLILLSLLAAFQLPQIPGDLNKIALSNPTRIYADDGRVVKVLADRQVVPLSQISLDYLHAVLAVEDAGFYSHHGLSKRGLLRAMIKNLRAGRIREGGSTITQQLAKNLFFSFDRTWWRKIKEVFIALQIEQQFSKDDILNAYVNQIPFGSGVYGVELAAQIYFGKHADELTLAEAAMLAGISNLPARYNPYAHEERARRRMAVVLKRMQDEGFISEEQRQQALAADLTLQRLNVLQGHAEYFIDTILKSMGDKYGQNAVNYGGFKIYTSLNTRFQYEASRAVSGGLAKLDEILGLASYEDASWQEKLNYPQAALVALDPRTGAIKALVGGRDYKRAPFNRAMSNNRQAGSSFKLFTYFAALDKGLVSPKTVLVDEPVRFNIYNQVWEPGNFEKTYDGPMVLKWALMESKNVIAAKLMEKVGPETVVKYAHQLGIQSPLEAHMSLALGSVGVSPFEMASAYSTIDNEGIRRTPFMVKLIKTSEDKTVRKQEMESRKVFDAQTCYVMIDMLRGVVEGGTGKGVRRLGFRRPCAGKTGTTNDYRDAWFVGFTPDLVTAVWVGFDDNRPMKDKNGVGLTGGRAALPIWTQFMKKALAGTPFSDFSIPPGIEFEEVDPRTGTGPMPGGPKLEVAVRRR